MDKPGASHSQEPLPQAGISEILGLVELLNSKGGREDIYKLAQELQMEFGDTLKVIRGAELLGFVNTPGGDVVLEALGEKVTRIKISGRKEIVGEQLEKLPLFKRLTEYLKSQEEHRASRDKVIEKLAELIPNEDSEHTFQTLVNWGRYAEIFGYNDDTETFYIDNGETQA